MNRNYEMNDTRSKWYYNPCKKWKGELWCPKPDEYCWFLKEGEPPQLAKFYRKEYNTYIGLIALNNTVGNTTKPLIVYAKGIEPFVGVPSCYD